MNDGEPKTPRTADRSRRVAQCRLLVGNEIVETTMSDIGPTGGFVATTLQLPINCVVVMGVPSWNDPHLFFTLAGRVTQVVPKKDESSQPGLGVQFLKACSTGGLPPLVSMLLGFGFPGLSEAALSKYGTMREAAAYVYDFKTGDVETDGMEVSERRRHRRVPYQTGVRCTLDAREYDCSAHNLSAKGAFIGSRDALPRVGDKVYLSLPLVRGTEHSSAKIIAQAKWVLTRPVLGLRPGFGVRFETVHTPQDVSSIGAFVEQLLADQKTTA